MCATKETRALVGKAAQTDRRSFLGVGILGTLAALLLPKALLSKCNGTTTTTTTYPTTSLCTTCVKCCGEQYWVPAVGKQQGYARCPKCEPCLCGCAWCEDSWHCVCPKSRQYKTKTTVLSPTAPTWYAEDLLGMVWDGGWFLARVEWIQTRRLVTYSDIRWEWDVELHWEYVGYSLDETHERTTLQPPMMIYGSPEFAECYGHLGEAYATSDVELERGLYYGPRGWKGTKLISCLLVMVCLLGCGKAVAPPAPATHSLQWLRPGTVLKIVRPVFAAKTPEDLQAMAAEAGDNADKRAAFAKKVEELIDEDRVRWYTAGTQVKVLATMASGPNERAFAKCRFVDSTGESKVGYLFDTFFVSQHVAVISKPEP